MKYEQLRGAARERLTKQVVDLYKTMSIREIAARIDRSYGWVHRALHQSGVEMRSAGRPRSSRRPS